MLEWQQAEQALQQVIVTSNPNNGPVSILACSSELHCIGIGTDAAVFVHKDLPKLAFKVYTEDALKKKDVEAQVYKKIGESPYFAKYYGSGDRYLVLSREHGINLYDCLLQGVIVPEQVIQDVETAREYIRSLGLNPRDIHLRNVLIQNGRAKVIDVSEYVKEGNDQRWEHLLWAYQHLYPLIEGKQTPLWILETIRHWYRRIDKTSFALEEFSKQVVQLFTGSRK